MSISPERYCLGGLMKDIEKELSSGELDNSNDITTYKSSQDKIFSSNDTYLPPFTTFFSPSLENLNIFSKSKNEELEKSDDEEDEEEESQFSQKNILAAFNNQKTTKQLQKCLGEESEENIELIIKELKGQFRNVIKNRNGNYFFSDLLKVCNQEQRIEILKELSPYISEDCSHEFGTHPIQHLIELSSSEEEYKLLLASFNDYNKVLLASLNQNGSFVIQKLIVNIPEKIRIQFNCIFVQFICVLSSDMNISKNLKEEAKNIYKEKLDGKNYALESSIYKALKDLYNELAIQQEQSKNYKKAIELLHKLLEVLETAKTITGKVKNGLTEKEIEDKKTEAYLKIANIYYIIKDYDHTISTLDLIPDIKKEDYSSLTVSKNINF